VGGETAGGKGQSTAARVGAELGLAAEETLGLAADAAEEGDGAAAGGRTASRIALSTASVASTTAAATRRRGQGTIGLDRSAFMLH
jgi:hypothetical protein